MLILLGVLLTALAPSSEEAAQAGRDVFHAGICGVLGWDLDPDQAAPLFVAVAAAHPGATEDQIIAGASVGGDAARAEFESSVSAAKKDRASLALWSEAMALRCDGLTGKYPLLLRRGPETDDRWAAQREALQQQIEN